MSDEASAPSNGASEAVTIDAGQVTAPAASEPSSVPSARDALEQALASVAQDGETQPQADGRNRDPATGRFAPKAADAAPQGEQVEQPAAETPSASTVPVPSRFTAEAKAEWDKAPEAVRQEVARMERELVAGIEKYREAAEAFEPMRPFHQLAQQFNVKLEDAIHTYVTLDQLWSSDPITAFIQTCQRTKNDPMQLIAALTGQQQVNGNDPLMALHRQIAQQQQLIAQLHSQVTGVAQTFEQQQVQSAQRQVLSEIDAFAKDHPHLEALMPTMTDLINGKIAKNLSEAYEKAVRLTPEIAAKIDADKAPKQPPASNAKAALSITGTPQSGSNPATRKPAGSAREALQDAFSQLGLS